MKKFWDNLGAREKLYILAGAGLAIAILLVQFAILPFWEERERVARAVEAQEKILKEMNTQLAEYRLLRRDMDALQRAVASRPPNFTLYSFVERKAREAGVRGNVKAINPSRGMSAGSFEETMADVSLESPEYLTATVQLATYQAAAGPRPVPAPGRQRG
jgi:type II secretory pathway component PulM